MNLKYAIYVIMILHRLHNFGTVDSERIYRINDKVISCSGWLSSIIVNFCNGTYKIVKRDTTSVMIEKLAPKELQRSTNIQRLVHESRWLRVRRQVASECCVRSCTVADLIMYCPSDAELLKLNPDIFE